MDQRALSVLLVSAFILTAVPRAFGESRVDLVSQGVPSAPSDTATGPSGIPAASRSVLSADGRWLVFTSKAPDLVPGQVDREETEDVFLLDRVTGTRMLVSHRAGSAVAAGDELSSDPVISADGRWIAFVSTAKNLVDGQVDVMNLGDNADRRDVFLYDRLNGATILVSHVAGSPLQAAQKSFGPVLSADGAVIAFESRARNLIAGQDPYWDGNIFLFQRLSGTIGLVSRRAASPTVTVGGHSPEISADGRFVVFASRAADLVPGQVDPLGEDDIFLYDGDTGTNVLVSHAAGSPLTAGNAQTNWFFRYVLATAALSADGRWVAFTNLSSDLLAGQVDPTTESMDVFLWDRTTDTTVLVSRSDASPTTSMGGFLVDLSADGGWVAFGHPASTNADSGQPAVSAARLVLFGRDTGATTLVNHAAGSPSTESNGWMSDAALSADGRFVVFGSLATDLVAGAVDTNDALDVFLYDRLGGGTTLLSHAAGSPTAAAGGGSMAPRISADGAFAAFATEGSDLGAGVTDLNEEQDVVLRDRVGGTNSVVSLRDPDILQETPHGASQAEGLSADGRFVVFTSEALDVIQGVSDPNGSLTDVFLWDRDTGVRTLVSRSAAAPSETANGLSDHPAISADGRWVTFQSHATNLVAGQSDGNGVADIFVWDRLDGSLRLVSGSGGSPTTAAAGASERPAISTDGRWIAFLSAATDLVDGQVTTVAGSDAFLWDRDTGATVLVSRAGGSAFQGAGASMVVLSADGSSVGFLSSGTSLVPGQVDTAGTADVFLFDRGSSEIRLVSHASTSLTTAGDGPSLELTINREGSRVAFTSEAGDLVPGQMEGNDWEDLDVFLWTRSTGDVLLVSREAGSATVTAVGHSMRPSLSADGRLVAFQSSGTNLVAGQIDRNSWTWFDPWDIFLFDVDTGSMRLVSHQHGIPNATGFHGSGGPVLSADGLAVAFSSSAQDLLSAPMTGFGSNVFVFERLSGRNKLASRPPAFPLDNPEFGSGSPWISSTGAFVAFTSRASNLVPGDFNRSNDVFLFSDPPAASDLFLVTPCRLLDTRQPEDGPAVASGSPAILYIQGGCGIPATARILVLNVTVVQPTGAGYLTLYPGDALPPLASTVNFAAGGFRTNNAIVPLSVDGSNALALRASVVGNGTVHVILDVVGYFE